MAILNITIPDADETTKGIAEVATQAETNTGTDDEKILTPLKLAQSDLVQTTIAANTAKVTNANHTGDATGDTSLTLATVNGDTGSFTNANITVNEKGLVTAASDGASGGTKIVDQIFFNVNNNALANSTTYYLGQTTIYASGSTSLCHIPLPTGTLTSVEIITWTTNTVGAEEATLTLVHAGGSIVLATNVTFNSRNNFINITGLTEAITAGGAYLTLVTPAYATNPGNSQIRTHLTIEV